MGEQNKIGKLVDENSQDDLLILQAQGRILNRHIEIAKWLGEAMTVQPKKKSTRTLRALRILKQELH